MTKWSPLVCFSWGKKKFSLQILKLCLCQILPAIRILKGIKEKLHFTQLLVDINENICVCSVTQLCLTLWNSMDCSLPGSSVHGIFQARILEWVAISFSRLHMLCQIQSTTWKREWFFKTYFFLKYSLVYMLSSVDANVYLTMKHPWGDYIYYSQSERTER